MPSSTLSPWRHLWQLQRAQGEQVASAWLRRQWPAALLPEGPARREQRLLLDAWISDALLGEQPSELEMVQALLQRQQRLHGLPDGRSSLEALLAAAQASGDRPTAVSALLQLLVLDGSDPCPLRQLELSESLALLGLKRQALALCRAALPRLGLPDRPRGFALAGLLEYRQGNRKASFDSFFEAVALGHRDPLTLQFLCRLQCQRGDLDAASDTLECIASQEIAALAARELRLRLGLSLQLGLADPGLREQIEAALTGGLLEDGSEILAAVPALLEQPSDVLGMRDALLRQRQRQQLANPATTSQGQHRPPLPPVRPARISRLGLLAPGFSAGSPGGLALALEPWLRQQGFELQPLASLHHEDAGGVTALQLAGLETAEAADLVRQQGLDALVDLCGSHDAHTLSLLQQRLAPRQLGWYAHNLTTGLRELDYLLVDRFQAPTLRDSLVEGLLVLPGSFLALSGSELALPPLQAATDGDLVVLAPARHLQQASLQIWAAILAEQPQRRLGFLHPSYGQEQVWARLLSAAQHLGINPQQLWRCPLAQHDVPAAAVLDPWPWGHWRSALGALHLGVPVLPRRGPALHQRRTAALLDLLGLGAFVADDAESALAIACTLLSSPQLQAELIAAIPQQLQGSLLYQPEQFAADLRSTLDQLPG